MTARTKSDRLRRLLSHGYFAPELPPCFVSQGLARNRRSILGAIDALPQAGGKPASHRYVSEPCWFYFPRFGKDDRRHGVPNPISYLLLARAVADNFIKLRAVAKRSELSASPPVFDWNGSRALVRPNVDLRDDFRVNLSSRREEFVAADVRAFFHSIYTHAIPWAIHGKAHAKRHRGVNEYGNLIDLLCRNGQDGQTVGLPVGPDTSRLIAEVIASAIDVELREKLGVTRQDASRYIDDYTIGDTGEVGGPAVIAALRQSLANFELELNNDKSSVLSTSSRHPTGWKQHIRRLVPTGTPDADAVSLFFYDVGQMCLQHPDINVEKFAIQNARRVLLRATNWNKVLMALINAYRRNSSLISLFCELVILRQQQHSDVDRALIKNFVENRIPILSQENRTGELIWLLFLSFRLQNRLSAKQLEPLSSIRNPMIALLVTWGQSQGLVQGAFDQATWTSSLNSDALNGPMWLYTYETAASGLLTGHNQAVEDHRFFGLLRAKRIRFFDPTSGFASLDATLRNLRIDNDRQLQLRADFSTDFIFDIDEFDDDEGEADGDGGY